MRNRKADIAWTVCTLLFTVMFYAATLSETDETAPFLSILGLHADSLGGNSTMKEKITVLFILDIFLFLHTVHTVLGLLRYDKILALLGGNPEMTMTDASIGGLIGALAVGWCPLPALAVFGNNVIRKAAFVNHDIPAAYCLIVSVLCLVQPLIAWIIIRKTVRHPGVSA